MADKIYKCSDYNPDRNCRFQVTGSYRKVLSEAVIHEMEEHAESDLNIQNQISNLDLLCFAVGDSNANED
jgi:predicted small metal-binding protein